MAGLLDRSTTDTPEPAAAASADAAPEAPTPEPGARACATCSAALQPGQDWCLECGSAQPGRLGGRPGWRAALTVLGVTGVLVGGAAAAAYAALSTDAQRAASAPPPPTATPTVAQAPAVPAPTQPAPAATDATPSVKAPASAPAAVPAPKSTPAPSTPAPSTPAPSSGTSGSTAGGTDTTSTQPAEPAAIDLPADAAAVYDPFKRAEKNAGDPADAIDGKADTAFDLPVAPDGTVRAGLLLSLEKASMLSDLLLKADTPGFTVEIYATKDPEVPPDVLDSRWEHVANRRDAGVEETIKLDGKYRHVLLWITEQPADTKVAIPEVQLLN